jgi:cell division septation protein DedD
MRDANARGEAMGEAAVRARPREKVELSLDGRQIASVVVGALVLLGVVFVLGLNVGRQIAARQAEASRAPSLEALDRAPLTTPGATVPASTLTFHETLTKERPPSPPVPKDAPAPPEPTAEQLAAAAPAPPAPRAAPASTTVTAVTASAKADDPAPTGAYTIQLGAAQDRADAERLAARFRSYSPRIEAADVSGKGRVYRVRVGSFDSRDAAARYLADVARETGAKGWVTASR